MSDAAPKTIAVADPIKGFYERRPYPQPVTEIPAAFLTGTGRAEGCPTSYAHIYWPRRPFRGALDVLIAGCGTAQAVQFAIPMPDTRFVAIDVSAESLAHSQALCERYGVKNVAHRPLRLEQAAELAAEFDLIVCTGVLHHTAAPDASLKALRSVLRPDGSLLLQVYGKYGRAGVYYIQEVLRRAGVRGDTASDLEVEAIRHLVASLPTSHPLLPLMQRSSDFRSTNGIADLFLNPRDQAYSVPGVCDLLRHGGFMVQDWLHRCHYEPSCLGVDLGPFGDTIDALPVAERFAIGELLGARVDLHMLVACRDDRPAATLAPTLDSDDWLNLIPVKHPAWVADRSSPRAPNRSEWIILPHYHQSGTKLNLDPAEATLFNHTDGQRTLGEIHAVASAGDSARPAWRRLFRYDLISFRTA